MDEDGRRAIDDGDGDKADLIVSSAFSLSSLARSLEST
jgi:hypothetical protein